MNALPSKANRGERSSDLYLRKLNIVFCVAGLLLVFASRAHADTIISPTNTNIQYTGRFSLSNPSRPEFGWSGSSIIANFEGTSLSARFDDDGDNYLYYRIDDGDPVELNLSSSASDYLLASGLSDGQHKIEIGKKSEGTYGEVKFLNFRLDNGKTLTAPPPRPPRKLIFFGDSNQAGYSAEEICDCGGSENEDSYYTYPAITSRMLDAEFQNVSASGITISHSWNIRNIWNKTYYGNGSGPTWDSSGDAPDAVIINLGANDLYASQSKSQIKNGWKNFISNELRGAYPNTHIVLANSYGWDSNEPANYVHEAVEELNNAGDANVSFVKFPWLWSQAHAVTFEQAGFANILAEHLANKLDLEQPPPNQLSSFAPPGQVPNGDLEKSNLPGVPDGWRFQGSGATYVEDASDAHSGTAFAQVTGGNSFFWHATDAIPGHEYQFGAWMRKNGNGTSGKLRIQFKDQGQQVISTFDKIEAVDENWEEVSFTATAPAGAWQVSVSILAGGANQTIDFDDLVLADLNGPPIAPADFDEDGDVDNVDLGIWHGAYGSSSLADADNDGDSDGLDFLLWQTNTSSQTSSSLSPVPEPTTWIIFLSALTGVSTVGPRSLR